MSELNEVWRDSVEALAALAEIGFIMRLSEDKRTRLVYLAYVDIEFQYGIDFLTGDVSQLWIDYPSGLGIPDPALAIFYFARADGLLPANGSKESSLFQKVDLYLNNRWIFEDRSWKRDEKFIAAVRRADKWAFKQFRPLSLWEYECYLRGLSEEHEHD